MTVMLSIIIPTYNEEQYLPYLLSSIKNQSFEDYEIIVADAGSEDGTREIAESYGCKVIEGGLPAVGRNNGAKFAKGEYLFFFDADVILTDEYLESALDEFKRNQLGIAITQMIPLSDRLTDKILHDIANYFMRRVEDRKPHGAGCCGILTKKTLHDEVNGFDESIDFGEDTDYIERIGEISSFKVLRKPRLLVSTRRLEKEGMKNLATKYTKSTLYQFVGRKITAEDLNYNFGYSEKRKRILYAVCGEGMGHAIRSSVIINHLLNENDVLIFASGKAFDYLKKRYDNVYYIYGFNTVYEDNTVNNFKTFLNAMKNLPRDLRDNLTLLYDIAEEFKPNIIISDFEFYSNLLSKLMRIPLISVDNMHVITQCKIDVPKKYSGDRLRAEGVIRSFIVMPERYLITTYFYPEVRNMEKVSLFPPILREEILNLKTAIGDYVLVYQTSASNLKLIQILKSVDEKFVVYGFNKEEKDGNLQYRKFNEDQFFKDLASCKAVLTNGGFSLIGEALYLKKPVLSVPVKKQFEQILNAIYLERLGYGKFHEELTKERLEKFLENLDVYRLQVDYYRQDGNQALLEALDQIIAECYKKY